MFGKNFASVLDFLVNCDIFVPHAAQLNPVEARSHSMILQLLEILRNLVVDDGEAERTGLRLLAGQQQLNAFLFGRYSGGAGCPIRVWPSFCDA